MGALLSSACTQPNDAEPLIGTFTLFNREAPYLIAAPHGEYDRNTDEIVYEFCESVRWDCLVAEGFRDDGAAINVNRPTEGTRLDETRFTERATLVYAKYVKRIRRLSPKVRFYAEIHGHENGEMLDTIDVASVGITSEQARFIRDEFERLLVAEGLPQLRVRVDVLERIRYKATHAREFGVLSFISPAIHVELPPSARMGDRARTVNVLARFLPELTRRYFPYGAQVSPPAAPAVPERPTASAERGTEESPSSVGKDDGAPPEAAFDAAASAESSADGSSPTPR